MISSTSFVVAGVFRNTERYRNINVRACALCTGPSVVAEVANPVSSVEHTDDIDLLEYRDGLIT